MHGGVFFLACSVLVVVYGDQIPTGFIPLPPLPLNPSIPPQIKTKPTQKPKVTPKVTVPPSPTQPPTLPTKPKPKPTTTKMPPSVTQTFSPKPSPTTKQNCGLTLNVPNSNCPGGNSAVQQRLDQLKQELSRTRAQHQAQNSALQNMIGTLQNQQSGYVSKIADLQNEVAKLVGAYNSISSQIQYSTPGPRPSIASTSAPSPASTFVPSFGNVQQAIQNVRDDLNVAVSDVNARLFNLSFQMQNNMNQESQAHLGIENQILVQASQVGKVTQQIQNLEKQLLQLNTTGNTPPVTGATNANIKQLQQQVQKVERDLQVYDNNQQQQYTNLQTKTTQLATDVANHTSDINFLTSTTSFLGQRLSSVETEAQTIRGALIQFRQNYEPRLKSVEDDVKDVAKNVTSVSSRLTSLGRTVLDASMKATTNKVTLASIKKQADDLDVEVNKISTGLKGQETEIQNLKASVISLKSAVPGSSLTTMNALINKIVNTPGSVKPSDIAQLKQALMSLQNALSKLSTGTTPSG